MFFPGPGGKNVEGNFPNNIPGSPGKNYGSVDFVWYGGHCVAKNRRLWLKPFMAVSQNENVGATIDMNRCFSYTLILLRIGNAWIQGFQQTAKRAQAVNHGQDFNTPQHAEHMYQYFHKLCSQQASSPSYKNPLLQVFL